MAVVAVVHSVVRSLALAGLCACSSSAEIVLPYPVGRALVFGESPTGVVATPMGPSCTSAACRAARESCGADVFAEVVLGTAGDVLDVICYRGDLGVRELEDTPFEVIGEQSETVFVFDGIDDGADLLDEVTVSGESDVLFGRGPALSVLGGALTIDGPRTIVRALTVRGDVTIERNDVKLSLVEILGDLTINGDQATLSESVVHGRVQVAGSYAVLARNLLQGAVGLTGPQLECVLNQRFDDRNHDGDIQDTELGREVACQAASDSQ